LKARPKKSLGLRPPPSQTQSKAEFEGRVLAAKEGDLETYAWAVHNLHIEKYQTAWAEALETENRLLIVCPPDTYKSTTVRLFVERAIGHNPDIRVLWIMNAGEQAEKNVMTVQQTIEHNNVYRRAFNVIPNKAAQWTKSVLFVERSFSAPDPTLMATGLNGPYQGLHFDIIIIDDPTNQEDVRSPTTMNQQEMKLRGVIVDRLLLGGRIVGVMTRWGAHDLRDTFAAMGFTIVEMPVLGDYPWGPTLSPTKFPLDRIEGIRRDKGDYLFAMTFMCDVEAATGAIIARDHIQYWEITDIKTALQLYAGVDPAASTNPRADRAAIATVGIDPRTRKIYQIDMWAKRVEVPDLKIEIIRKVNKTSGLRKVALETTGFQLGLMQDLRRTGGLPMMEIPYRTRESVKRKVIGIDRSKEGRAMYLDSLFTSDRLYLAKDNPICDGVSLEAELCTFGTDTAPHDDRADALSFACIAAESAMAFKDLRIPVRIG